MVASGAGIVSTGGDDAIDDYRIVRELGRGGATFLAHDRFLDRAVVLTLLPREGEARAARLEVARAFARASHPNLGRVHRVREGGDRPYVVAAFARGPRLDTVAVPLANDRVVAIGRGLAGALGELHASGVAHGHVSAARVFLGDDGAPRLVGLDRARARADDAAKRADLEALVALVSGLAGGELADAIARLADPDDGVATADELRRALEALGRPAADRPLLEDNPYRGLRGFDEEHAEVFFGRARETADLVERLRAQPWLLIAGRSGTGKSSLARAGIAAAIGALGERPVWDVAAMVPGARPLDALARALAPLVDYDRDELHAALTESPALAGRLARARIDRGLLLVVDQLEEVITLAEPDERAAFSAALERFGALAPGVRVVFTLRGDFLDRLVELGPFGADLTRAAYVLPPMTRDALREAIVAPAHARGVSLEDPATIDALVDEVTGRDEALPLLSFAMSELWSQRDPARTMIPAAAAQRLGGAVAALARHGDLVIDTLSDDGRRHAKRILLALVTADETRARRSPEDLVGSDGPRARRALEALVRGRIVVAGETYAIAHEALVRAWPRLRAWLDEASQGRAAAARLRAAAAEWTRLGRDAAQLWTERQLRDLEAAGATDGIDDAERSFVEASRAAAEASKRRRRAPWLGVPIAVALAAVAALGVSGARSRGGVARALAAAHAIELGADEDARRADAIRAEAIARFERDDVGPAEASWRRMLALEDDVDRQRREVGALLDEALAIDPRDAAARAGYADLTLARLLAAERLHHDALVRELSARLDAYDDGSRARALDAPGRVVVVTDPPGVPLTLARFVEDAARRLVPSDLETIADGDARDLPIGSYLLTGAAPDRYPTRYPFVVRRGQDQTLRVVLPRAADVPASMVYVPAGRTVYGSSDDEASRSFFSHQPAHDVDVAAFLIGRTEVTCGDYLAFLAELPTAERAARVPRGLVLRDGGRVAWRLRDTTLEDGEPYCNGPCVDWRRLPVDGASRDDAERYAAWLARTGRIAGARLCTDREWERAARGADGRVFPSGNELGADDACSLASYGGDALRAGPCAAGTHPASRSVFGVDDMAGSDWEWTSGPADVAHPAEAVQRSAGWSDFGTFLAISNRSTSSSPQARGWTDGLRVCADVR